VLLRACDHALRPDNRFQSTADEIVYDLKKQSQFDTLIEQLAKVFQKHFGERARINRSDDENKDTSYIKFVLAVLEKLNLPKQYAVETVIRATSTARSGRGRRKAREPGGQIA
jgi:hypothetical protein